MSGWIAELSPGCWLASWTGDPGRTVIEPTGAELVGKACQLSLFPINTNRDGIRDTVVMYDAQRDEYHGAGGQSKPWKYARIYQEGRPLPTRRR